MRGKFTEAITGLEESTHPWWLWAATFVALVVSRNLLEGALGPQGSIGFLYTASNSALMVLDHFLLFYVALFLSIAILLSALARVPLGRVMKVMTPAWVVILVPPFADYLASSGEGIRISYIGSLGPAMLRFFDPTATLDRISVGQRVEVAGACVLAAVYSGLRTRSALRAVGAFAGVYAILAVAGFLPMMYARACAWIAGAGPATPEQAYNAAFKMAGLVFEESRKLALLFLLPAAALGWLAYRLQAPSKALAMRYHVRPLRTLHYVGMTLFGMAFGFALFVPAGVRLSSGGDYLGFTGALLAAFLTFLASVALNDIFDEEGDRVVGARRPLVAGTLSRRDAAGQAGVLAAAALLLAMNVRYATFLLLLLGFALSFVYSAPPLRLKRVPVVSTLMLGLGSLIMCLVGFSVFAEERALAAFPARLGWLIVLSFGLGFAAKDLKDVEGDRRTGVYTLPVLLGPKAGRIAVAILVLLSYLCVPALLPYRWLAVPAVLVGAASAAIVFTWRRPRVDNVLLAVSLIFTLVVAIAVLLNPAPLMDRQLPLIRATALEWHGAKAEALRDWNGAAQYFGAAAAILGADQDALAHTGVALSEAGRHAEAVPVLSRAFEINPEATTTAEYLAVSLSRSGNVAAAERFMLEAIRRSVRPRVFSSLLGEEYLRLRRPREAAGAFARAILLGQPDMPARLRLGDALLAAGLKEEARSEYLEAVDRRPSSAEAWDALGKFYDGEGAHGPAAAAFRRATELAPRESVYWNNLGVALRLKRDYEPALAALAEATSLAPRMVDPYYNRGEILRAMGREEEARRQYLLALEIDPSFAPARRALR